MQSSGKILQEESSDFITVKGMGVDKGKKGRMREGREQQRRRRI